MIKVIHLQRGENPDRTYFVTATRSDASKFFCGDNRMTERGSKTMLTKRAKQFGLAVVGNEAK